jgi:hypothetical protein
MFWFVAQRVARPKHEVAGASLQWQKHQRASSYERIYREARTSYHHRQKKTIRPIEALREWENVLGRARNATRWKWATAWIGVRKCLWLARLTSDSEKSTGKTTLCIRANMDTHNSHILRKSLYYALWKKWCAVRRICTPEQIEDEYSHATAEHTR